MERLRKDAKSLLSAFRAGDAEAVARVRAVLGKRAEDRFLLSDAQHVLARENGYSTWAELKAATGDVLEPGPVYRAGEPVRIRIRKRGYINHLDDGGAAVGLAGKPPGWLEAAARAVDKEGMNVSRTGRVFVGVGRGRDIADIARRLAESSVDVYEALLELQD